MCLDRCQRVKNWFVEQSESGFAQWIASLGTGAGFASGVHYTVELGLSLSPLSGGVLQGLRVANYVLTGLTFIVGTAMAKNQVYKNITTGTTVGKEFPGVKRRAESNSRENKKNHRDTLAILGLFSEVIRKTPALAALNAKLEKVEAEVSHDCVFIDIDDSNTRTVHSSATSINFSGGSGGAGEERKGDGGGAPLLSAASTKNYSAV